MYPSFDRSEAFDDKLLLIDASEGRGSSEGKVALDGQDQAWPDVSLALAIRYNFELEQLIIVHPCDYTQNPTDKNWTQNFLVSVPKLSLHERKFFPL